MWRHRRPTFTSSHKSMAGTTIEVTGSGDAFTVDGTAKLICGNAQTANATI